MAVDAAQLQRRLAISQVVKCLGKSLRPPRTSDDSKANDAIELDGDDDTSDGADAPAARRS